MEFISGVNLREWMLKKKPKQSEVRKISAGILRGIEHLHLNDILHCGLSLEEVIVREDGTPVILEFDLSKDAEMRGKSLNRSER